jgi:cyanophycinase
MLNGSRLGKPDKAGDHRHDPQNPPNSQHPRDPQDQQGQQDPPDPAPGPLLAIGGAEDKLGRRSILSRFVELAGGRSARIAVVPTASSLGPEIVEVYDALFRRLGAREVVAARPETREEAADPAVVELLDDVTGIFMTGGNQLKLSAIVNGTPFGDAIVAARGRGVVVAGTSAGASIQSSHMVAFGPGGSTPKQRMTQLAAGLGLVRDVVIDQHFAQRNRYGRLLMLVAQSPGLLGIGVDEDTAALITVEDGAEVLRVVGRGVVTVFDGRSVVSNAHQARHTAPLLASGVVLHVLPEGSAFDLTARALVPAVTEVDPGEAEELAVAGRDLARLARDIAAGDVSPSVLRRRRARRTSEPDRQGDRA